MTVTSKGGLVTLHVPRFSGPTTTNLQRAPVPLEVHPL